MASFVPAVPVYETMVALARFIVVNAVILSLIILMSRASILPELIVRLVMLSFCASDNTPVPTTHPTAALAILAVLPSPLMVSVPCSGFCVTVIVWSAVDSPPALETVIIAVRLTPLAFAVAVNPILLFDSPLVALSVSQTWLLDAVHAAFIYIEALELLPAVFVSVADVGDT